jgi:hypothetical protein
MGHADALQYLDIVRRPLEALAGEIDFRFRIVSTRTWDDAPLAVEFIPWTRDANREALLSSTVGISPLPDDHWNRGRSASRLVHYSGHALPAVASPVGITDQVLLDQRTGFLASSEHEWHESLRQLLVDPDLVDRMGRCALTHVAANYSDAVAKRLWRAALSTRSLAS